APGGARRAALVALAPAQATPGRGRDGRTQLLAPNLERASGEWGCGTSACFGNVKSHIARTYGAVNVGMPNGDINASIAPCAITVKMVARSAKSATLPLDLMKTTAMAIA